MNQYRSSMTAIYKPIPKEEQFSIYTKIINGDQESRNELIHSCLPLVYDIAKKFHINNKHVDIEDLIQNGNLALIKAVNNWNPDKANITTVATHYITNALIDTIKDSKYSVKNKYEITRQAMEDIKKIKKSGANSIDEIVTKTKLSVKRVKKLLNVINGKRIDYSLINNNIHTQNEYSDGDFNCAGCLADVYEILNKNVESERDRNIFISWIEFINKNNRVRLVAKHNNCTTKEVNQSIKHTRNILKRVVAKNA